MEPVAAAIEVEEDKEEDWDVETIVSTYSNLYNHPKLLDEPRQQIRISKKTGGGSRLGVAEELGCRSGSGISAREIPGKEPDTAPEHR